MKSAAVALLAIATVASADSIVPTRVFSNPVEPTAIGDSSVSLLPSFTILPITSLSALPTTVISDPTVSPSSRSKTRSGHSGHSSHSKPTGSRNSTMTAPTSSAPQSTTVQPSGTGATTTTPAPSTSPSRAAAATAQGGAVVGLVALLAVLL